MLHVDYTGRHGSRYPKETETELIPELLNYFYELTSNFSLSEKGEKLFQKARSFSTWTKAHLKCFSDITPRGWQELYDLGFRNTSFLTAFRRLPPKSLTISLSSSEITRTIHSQEAFWEGFSEALPEKVELTSYLNVLDNPRWVLHSYKLCRPVYGDFSFTHLKEEFSARKETLEKNLPEAAVHFAREIMPDCPTEIAPRLLETVYRLCLLDVSRKYPLGLCEVPAEWIDKPEGTKVLGWLRKIQSWRKFYDFGLSEYHQGKAINLASPLLRDILDQLEQGVYNNPENISANYRFSHDSMIAKLLSKLEIIPPKGTDDERFAVWNPSYHTPMGANVQLHLYQCSDNNLQIQLLLNEQQIDWKIPPCHNQPLCSWQQARDYLRDKIVPDEVLKEYCSVQ
nr:histidine-type phosphatase [Sansalvadorimonas sp. 2012CJ34-2]